MITNLEVATAELKNGIYEVNATREIDRIVSEGVHYISKAMLGWYVDNEMVAWPIKADYIYENHTTEQLCELYLTWYYEANQVSVTIDVKGKPVSYELIYTVKDATIYPWLLVDEDLNIKEPHNLPINQQHFIRHEAHFAEATKDQPLNF